MRFVLCAAFFCANRKSIHSLNNEELRMKQWYSYLHSSFPFFQDYAIKAEIIWINYHLSSEEQNKQNDWQETDTGDTGCGW